MTVSLSLLGGAGWQFFDNNGNPLTGGKLYTYEAGTSTPALTYTSASGSTPNSNPIVLDAAGRVSEEIWLSDGVNYKFVLKTSDEVTIWTKDNISSQTNSSADLSNTTDVAKGDALVGFRQSDANGALVGAVGKTVHQKLQDLVTITDFGATPGSDCAAQMVLAAAATSGTVVFPAGAFVATATTANSAAILGLLQRIQIDGTLVITLASGVHTFTSPVVVSSNVVNGLQIVGSTPVNISIGGQVSVGGTAGAYLVELNVSSVSGVAVGDFLHTYNVTGTGVPEVHRGVWEITNVDTPNSRITVKNTARTVTFPTNTIATSTSLVLKTVLRFNNCDGIVVKDSCIDFLNNVAIVGNSDSYWSSSNVTGTEKGTHGLLIGAESVALNGKSDHVNQYGVSQAHVSCGRNVGVNGFDQQGIVVELGGTFWGDFVSSCNNKRRGFYASTAAGIRAKHISANGNFLDGCIADIGGNMYSSSVSCAVANGQRGVSATSSGSIVFDTGIMSYNGTHGGAASNVGYLQATGAKYEFNGQDGAYAEYNSEVYAANSTINGNGRNGIYPLGLSTIRANTCDVTNNTSYGIRCDDKSLVIYTGSTISGNTAGSFSLRNNSLVIGTNSYGGEVITEFVNFKNISTNKGGQITATSGGESFVFGFDAVTAGVYVAAYRMRSNTDGFTPEVDGTQKLGRSANRWSEVFAVNGTINTSDAREKQQVRGLLDAERAVAMRLKSLIRAFKFNDAVSAKGDKARIHFGVLAQDVEAAFQAEGLVAEEYGLFCYDEWPEQPEIVEPVVDDNGAPTGELRVVQSYRAAGNRYGIRYEELLAFVVAAL